LVFNISFLRSQKNQPKLALTRIELETYREALFGSLEGRRREGFWGVRNIGKNGEIFHNF